MKNMTDKFKEWVSKPLLIKGNGPLGDFIIKSIYDYVKMAFDEIEKEAKISFETKLHLNLEPFTYDECINEAFENKKKEWGI